MEHTSSDRPAPHVVLVPGFWLGAWAWDDVLVHLRDRGVDAVALTLPGLEPDHPDRGAVSLEDHVRAVEDAVVAAPEGSRVVLVAHSGAAVPATVALDRHVDRVDHVVWVDTAPVVDGFALADDAEGAEHPLSAQWDDELEQGAMADLCAEQLATFQERAVPQPAGTMREAARLTDERRLDVPMTIVATAFSGADYRSYAEQGAPFLAGVLEFRALELVDLPTGHWPMWSRPEELAQIIADRTREPAPAGEPPVDAPPAPGAGLRGGAVDSDDLALVLHEQLDWHWRIQARARLEGLTDEELHWEPAPGAWGVRRREDEAPASATFRAGAGDWVVDWAVPEPEPPPVTTIAWRLAHIVVGVLGARVHSHFGGPECDYLGWDYAGTAADSLRQLDEGYAAWSAGVRSLTPAALAEPVGPAEGPWAEEPMLTLVLHINREMIHHLAEIALLRDLWAHRRG